MLAHRKSLGLKGGKVRKSVFIVFALIGLASSIAQAASIVAPITSGYADVDGAGNFDFLLNGANVSFSGKGATTFATCLPASNLVFPCTPGSTENEGIVFTGGNGISGNIAAGGESFAYMATAVTKTSAAVDFQFSFTLPSLVAHSSNTLTLNVPFTVNASFGSPKTEPPFDLQGFSLNLLNGQGVATIDLQMEPSASGAPVMYQLQDAHLAFVAPEPAGVLLSGLGLLGLSLLGRKLHRGCA
jgi:hypothetical protein